MKPVKSQNKMSEKEVDFWSRYAGKVVRHNISGQKLPFTSLIAVAYDSQLLASSLRC